MICASEDVSNADPMALVVATSAAQAVERIGMPEAQIILARCGYLCGECAKEQLRRYGDQRGDGDSQKYDDSSGSATFTGRPLQIIIEARSRRRL